MPRLKNGDKELILADFHTGQFSQRDLSMKYQVSVATINKITKGNEPKNLDKVNAQMAINRDLAEQSEQEVNAFTNVIATQMRRENLVFDIQEKALGKARIMLDQVDTPSDLKTIVETVDKAAITLRVADRHAPKIDVTQQTAIATNSTPIVEIIEDKG